MSHIVDLPKDERASFWRDTHDLRLYLIGSLFLVVSYRLYMILAPGVASWWHVRTALETMSRWWK